MNRILALAAFCLFLLTPPFLSARAAHTQRVWFSQIRPTQAVAGFSEIEYKIKKLAKIAKNPADLEEYLRDKAAPAVVGPDGFYYIVDRHHELSSMLAFGLRKAYVEVIADFSELSIEEFRKEMLAHQWVYLRDEYGRHVETFETLPKSLSDLRDDPYRALAWFLKRDGYYKKSKIPYSDFEWANALRFVIPRKIVENDFERAYELAEEFAKSKEAQHLPGARKGPVPAARSCATVWLHRLIRF